MIDADDDRCGMAFVEFENGSVGLLYTHNGIGETLVFPEEVLPMQVLRARLPRAMGAIPSRVILEHLAKIAEKKGIRNVNKILLRGRVDDFTIVKAAEISKSLTIDDYRNAMAAAFPSIAPLIPVIAASSEVVQQLAAARREEQKTFDADSWEGTSFRWVEYEDGTVGAQFITTNGALVNVPPEEVLPNLMRKAGQPGGKGGNKTGRAHMMLESLAKAAEKKGVKDAGEILQRGRVDDSALAKAAEIRKVLTIDDYHNAMAAQVPIIHPGSKRVH